MKDELRSELAAVQRRKFGYPKYSNIMPQAVVAKTFGAIVVGAGWRQNLSSSSGQGA